MKYGPPYTLGNPHLYSAKVRTLVDSDPEGLSWDYCSNCNDCAGLNCLAAIQADGSRTYVCPRCQDGFIVFPESPIAIDRQDAEKQLALGRELWAALGGYKLQFPCPKCSEDGLPGIAELRLFDCNAAVYFCSWCGWTNASPYALPPAAKDTIKGGRK